MDLTWTPWAVPGILALPVAWGEAIVVLRTAPHRSVNLRLAVLLLLEGAWMGGTVFFLVEDPAIAWAIGVGAVAAMVTLPFVYLAFLAVALDTPLVAPFRSRWALVLLTAAAVGTSGWVLVAPSNFLGDLYSPDWATWNFVFRPMGQRSALFFGATSLFGLVAAIDALRRATPGTAARSRAKWFVVAFGIRDVYTGSTMLLYPTIRDVRFWGDFLYNPGQTTIYLIFVILLAYAVLRTQLFDIDLKIKFALKQSTVGAVFAVGFFVGSELLEEIVPVRGTLLGLLVSGAIVLVLHPVQRFAEAVSDRLMGGVSHAPEYIRGRKREVYRAAVEGALEDGAVTVRERAILAHLREELGITEVVARNLERQVANR